VKQSETSETKRYKVKQVKQAVQSGTSETKWYKRYKVVQVKQSGTRDTKWYSPMARPGRECWWMGIELKFSTSYCQTVCGKSGSPAGIKAWIQRFQMPLSKLTWK